MLSTNDIRSSLFVLANNGERRNSFAVAFWPAWKRMPFGIGKGAGEAPREFWAASRACSRHKVSRTWPIAPHLISWYPLAEMYLQVLHCLRCGYKWPTRRTRVKRCAKCRTPYWNKERKNSSAGKPNVPGSNPGRVEGAREPDSGKSAAEASVSPSQVRWCRHWKKTGEFCMDCGGTIPEA